MVLGSNFVQILTKIVGDIYIFFQSKSELKWREKSSSVYKNFKIDVMDLDKKY